MPRAMSRHFTDPLVECGTCHRRFRNDALTLDGTCPVDGGAVGEARHFNLMFKTFLGPVEEDAATVYLRPETAQGIFVNFLNVQKSTSRRLPFGIAQIGKSFRNEISPGNFIFRSREFEQMECEYFVRAEMALDAYEAGSGPPPLVPRSGHPGGAAPPARARPRRVGLLQLRYHRHRVPLPVGLGRAGGHRPPRRLRPAQHSRRSGKDLSYVDDLSGDRFLPHVIEPAAGVDRSLLAFLFAAYDEEPDKDGMRTVLRLHRSLAPDKVAVLPLSKKDSLCAKARQVAALLRPLIMTTYDETASIGKRYRRQDEIGTPLCVTIDFETLDDDAVTIRDRDTMAQERVPIADVAPRIQHLVQFGY